MRGFDGGARRNDDGYFARRNREVNEGIARYREEQGLPMGPEWDPYRPGRSPLSEVAAELRRHEAAGEPAPLYPPGHMKLSGLRVKILTNATAVGLEAAIQTFVTALTEERYIKADTGHDGTNYWCAIQYVE